MSIWLSNVRLETGETMHEDGSIQTRSDLFHIHVAKEGIIQTIIPATENVPDIDIIDMEGKLALPAFKDMHNHLDKTYLSLGWKACRPVNSLSERLAIEAAELEELSETVTQRAAAMIELHLNNGVNHIRTHVNIDPFIKLKNLEGVKKALEAYEQYLTYEIVAFPQHGLLAHGEMPDLLRQALESGATILGALDPAGIDKDVEKSLQITMDIAKEYAVDVDMHLHDKGQVGFYTMDKWLDMVKEQKYMGKTTFSHAFGLSKLSPHFQKQFAKKLSDSNVEIMSTIPISINHQLIPIDLLKTAGVKVGLGCDGFYDSWSPYFSGDILEKVHNFCDYTGKSDERSLRQSLSLITQELTPLNREGEQVWPKIGAEASFVFVDASCSAEAVARLPKNRLLMHKGKIYKSTH
ncbi:amidohydrolase [Ornithinibacillus bavariensis]|uniref:Deaminase n=1 Tax=Ornithinibacillus bavariensis TaxID=545502 RepID=A0A920C8B2_9BACI|nr:amidohydrolase [Ornithinibacillus bavariensis]GIO28029.1 deaminase [Ornithinibacillus bavariensis]HAM80968.1 deaminase [Ornithinibacillus sp.]